MPITLGILAQSRQVVDTGAFQLLETISVGTAVSSVTFSSLGTYASTYQHLQVRWAGRTTNAGGSVGFMSRFNGDSGSNYAQHALSGTGSSVTSLAFTGQTVAWTGRLMGGSAPTSAFSSGVIDLLDPFEAKNKTTRTLNGVVDATTTLRVDLISSVWLNTASLTSWQLISDAGNLAVGTRISLYGVKATA
jgi:hypothetical protein